MVEGELYRAKVWIFKNQYNLTLTPRCNDCYVTSETTGRRSRPSFFPIFCCAFRCQLTFPSSRLIILITSVTALVMFTNLCLVLLSLLAGWLVSKVHLQLTKISQREAPGSVLWYSTLYQTIAECVISEIYYKVIYGFPEFPCFLLRMRTLNFFSRNTFKTGTILT